MTSSSRGKSSAARVKTEPTAANTGLLLTEIDGASVPHAA
jgi:hypothetical protein